MGKHPFVDDWNKEEAKVSKELTKNLNKSLNATKVLAEIDKKFPDPASGSKPPKGVADSFDTYAEISIKLQKSSYCTPLQSHRCIASTQHSLCRQGTLL